MFSGIESANVGGPGGRRLNVARCTEVREYDVRDEVYSLLTAFRAGCDWVSC